MQRRTPHPAEHNPNPGHRIHPGSQPMQRRPSPSQHDPYGNGAPPHNGSQPIQRRPSPSHDSSANRAQAHPGSQPQRRASPAHDSYSNGTQPHAGPQPIQRGPSPSSEPGQGLGPEPPSSNKGLKPFRAPCHVFDVFFDLPHPAASDNADRARMIEPPEVTNPEILAEVYEPSAIAKLARFAFPEHDDQKHALELQKNISNNERYMKKAQRRKSNNCSSVTQAERTLNKLDIYCFGYKSDRHTFILALSDGITKLYGHTMRYLPNHKLAKKRSDVGRRGVRAMVILTRANGGDRFYTSVLKGLASVMMQADALTTFQGYEDVARDKAMRLLHSIHRQQTNIFHTTMTKLQNKETSDLGDDDMTVGAVEFDLNPTGFIQDRILPGDYLQMQIPPSLQGGFRMGAGPDDYDVPIIPLLRTLGAGNTVRVVAGLMCERRMIFVSSDVGKLSSCVRALSALLAQGLLMWRYNMVPILPPHLFDLLIDPNPFIFGLLEDYLSDICQLDSLKEVLCVHLDKNQFKTFGKRKPSWFIPDVLSKSSKETLAHILYNDFQQILKAETRIWAEGKKTDDKTEKSSPQNDAIAKKKKLKNKQEVDTDVASLFGRVMRGESLTAPIPEKSASEKSDDFSVVYSVASDRHSTRHVDPSVATFEVCQNERGEEGLRAALTFFFLVTHGDLSVILSRSPDGTFLLDRKKYIMQKRRQGSKERSPLLELYKIFSGSAMLEYHLAQRIEEHNRGRSLLMPRHRPLFSLCEKHLRLKKVEFSYENIRQVVSKTSEHSPLHAHVRRSELARFRALALTSDQQFEGNVSQALSSLMQNCHQCDSSLPQTVAVIWIRLGDRSQSGWKHPLLGLHLLKNLLLHGPVSIISYALDGIDKIHKLRSYDVASKEHNREIRESAESVWELVIDSARLLLERRNKLAARSKLIDSKMHQRWGSYLLKKVPFCTDFRQYHTILRPKQSYIPAFMMEKEDGPTHPKDAQFVGQNVQEMAIVRMELTPLGGKKEAVGSDHLRRPSDHGGANISTEIHRPQQARRLSDQGGSQQRRRSSADHSQGGQISPEVFDNNSDERARRRPSDNGQGHLSAEASKRSNVERQSPSELDQSKSVPSEGQVRNKKHPPTNGRRYSSEGRQKARSGQPGTSQRNGTSSSVSISRRRSSNGSSAGSSSRRSSASSVGRRDSVNSNTNGEDSRSPEAQDSYVEVIAPAQEAEESLEEMLARRSASIQPLKQRQTKSTRSPRSSPSAQDQISRSSNRAPKRSGHSRRSSSEEASTASDCISALTDPTYERSTASHDKNASSSERSSIKHRGPIQSTIHEDKEESFSKLTAGEDELA